MGLEQELFLGSYSYSPAAMFLAIPAQGGGGAETEGIEGWEGSCGETEGDGKGGSEKEGVVGDFKNGEKLGNGIAGGKDAPGHPQTGKATEKRDDAGFRQNKQKDVSPGESDSFKDADLLGALADGLAHGIARHQQNGEEDSAENGD